MKPPLAPGCSSALIRALNASPSSAANALPSHDTKPSRPSTSPAAWLTRSAPRSATSIMPWGWMEPGRWIGSWSQSVRSVMVLLASGAACQNAIPTNGLAA